MMVFVCPTCGALCPGITTLFAHYQGTGHGVVGLRDSGATSPEWCPLTERERATARRLLASVFGEEDDGEGPGAWPAVA